MSECVVTCSHGRLLVAGEMTIYSAASAKDQLFDRANECGGNIELDLSSVTLLDTAGVQMMLMLRRLALAKGATFRLLKPSAAATEVLELCGLQTLIADLPVERAA